MKSMNSECEEIENDEPDDADEESLVHAGPQDDACGNQETRAANECEEGSEEKDDDSRHGLHRSCSRVLRKILSG